MSVFRAWDQAVNGGDSAAGWLDDLDFYNSTYVEAGDSAACSAGTTATAALTSYLISTAKSGYVGQPSPLLAAYKDIDVSFFAADIDAGDVDYDAKTWIATFTTDTGAIRLTFLDGTDSEISSVTGDQVADDCGWTQQQLTGTVPANTRTIRFTFLGWFIAGSILNAYFCDSTLDLDVPDLDEVRVTKNDIRAVVGTVEASPAEGRVTQNALRAVVGVDLSASQVEVRATRLPLVAVVSAVLGGGGRRKIMNTSVIT